VDELAVCLPDRAEVEVRLVRLEAGLLAELANGGSERLLVVVILSLGKRPRGKVLLRPERAARMYEEDLKRVAAAIHQQTCGAVRHRRWDARVSFIVS
jgi:hypothetical protein